MLGNDVLRGRRDSLCSQLYTNWPAQTIPILILGSPSYGSLSSPSIPGCPFCVYGYPQYTLYLLLLIGCWLEKQRKLSLARLVYKSKVFILGDRPLEDTCYALPPHSPCGQGALPFHWPRAWHTVTGCHLRSPGERERKMHEAGASRPTSWRPCVITLRAVALLRTVQDAPDGTAK